jgi:hypothetical protein
MAIEGYLDEDSVHRAAQPADQSTAGSPDVSAR